MQETLKVIHSNSWKDKDTKDDGPRSENREEIDASDNADTLTKDASDDLFLDIRRAGDAEDDLKDGEASTVERTDRDTAEDEPELLSGVRIDDEDARNTLVASETSHSTSTPVNLGETLWNPLLAVAAVLALLAAGWSYTSLQGTRAQLTAVSDAKVSVERALADVKSRLSVAEKTVSDIRAALAASAAVAATASEATASETPPAAASDAAPAVTSDSAPAAVVPAETSSQPEVK